MNYNRVGLGARHFKPRSCMGTCSSASGRRCEGKAAYPSMRKAEFRAERVSIREGELIIAYDCPDCGRFHIGHADLSQKLARQIPLGGNWACLQCGGPILERARQKAKLWRCPALYCSPGCRKAAANQL